MRARLPRVFDTSALVDWLAVDHRVLLDIADQADAGWFPLLFPTTAIAEAETELRFGWGFWEAIFYRHGLKSIELGEHAAVEIGNMPGPLSARHAVWAAADGRGVVVTRQPGVYQGLTVQLLAV